MNIKVLLRQIILPLKIFLFCIFLIFTSCQTTRIGIGDKTTQKGKSKITAYRIDYKKGFEIARQICSRIFDESSITEDGLGIRVYHEGNVLTEGTAGAFIYPTLVQNTKEDTDTGNVMKAILNKEDDTRTGVIFKVKTFGEGWNTSLVPGFMANMFFKELDKVAKQKKLPIISFKNYEILQDVSIVDKIPSSVPTNLEDFKSFLKNKQNLYPFEGIWSSDNGDYVLGIIFCSDNSEFNYKGFIISSDRGSWVPGEVKVQWRSLEVDDLCMGDWFAANKLKTTMVFKVSKKLIMSINAPRDFGAQVVLLKTYPISTSHDIESSGTGFAVSENGLIVTAYHVIKDAKTIKVHLKKDSFVSAKVMNGDPINDLAILKVESTTPNFLQVAPMRSVKTGDRVFTVGFPVSSVLGQEAKYTEGVVSSLSGLEGASSFLQITVPVQPGNSGGALLNEDGEVVGIVTSTAAILPFIEVSGTLPQNVNWAVKSDYLKPLIELPSIEQEALSREQLINHVKKATFLIESE